MDPVASAFERLHPKVQRWIWRQGWEELRDIQERSVPVLLDGARDAIVAAATASGKTEAAFLPIVSRLAWREEAEGERGIGALYISPLRALINDQFRRMEGLCEELDLPVFKWHGDVGQGEKARARRARSGIVLITPESLEAMLVRRPAEARKMLAGLAYVVIDELHAFLGQPRGKQLASLLHRIERLVSGRVARVGLSATLADLAAAAVFMRPGEAESVVILESSGASLQLRLALHGFVEPSAARRTFITSTIADHVFGSVSGTRSLIFAGSRSSVEDLSAKLADLCERRGTAREFFPHHGSLSREWREEAEARMRDVSRPASVVCTTTLELGIDVGAIESVAQIGPGHTVAGMRQRLGRSGRRPGQPAVMRVYVAEAPLGADTPELGMLRLETVQTLAMIELLLARWMEPPERGALHLSTLLHQILALVCQHGGVTARQAYETLVRDGAFGSVSPQVFQRLLRRMGQPGVGLLEQAPDGTILLGAEGERATSARDFYTVFHTPEEYRIVHGRTSLGTVPIDCLPLPDDLITVTGRYWKVESVDPGQREIAVQPAVGGKPPWLGAGGGPSDGVVRKMRELYGSAVVPRYADPTAAAFLEEARTSFAKLGLGTRPMLEQGRDTLLFPWVGARRQAGLALALEHQGFKARPDRVAILVEDATPARVRTGLKHLAQGPLPDPITLAALVGDKRLDKYDEYLDHDLQCANYASAEIDVSGLDKLATHLAEAT